MRLQTRTWDQNGPKFIFDATYLGEGVYTCELYFSTNPNCPIFIPIFLTEEDYKKNKYFIKDNLEQYILSDGEYSEEFQYYEKTEIEWEIKVPAGENFIIVSLDDENKFYGSFTMDEQPQGMLKLFQLEFKDVQQSDFAGFELNINWNGYTYANITRYEESQRGILNARSETGDSFYWAPELHYNNDYVRMTDELTIYWHYFYNSDDEDKISLILSERPKIKFEEGQNDAETFANWLESNNSVLENEVELTSLTLSRESRTAKIQLGSLLKQPTPGYDLYATIWAQGDNKISNKVRGIVAQINQIPNQPEIKLIGSSLITEEQSITLEVSAKNEAKIVIGETEKVIADETGIVDKNFQDEFGNPKVKARAIGSGGNLPGWDRMLDSFTEAEITGSGTSWGEMNIIVLPRPIPKEYLDNFTTLEVTIASRYNYGTFGLRKLRKEEVISYKNFETPEADEPDYPLGREASTLIFDLTSLNKDYDWYLVGVSILGHSISSMKLTGGSGTRQLDFLTNDPDNKETDFKNMSQDLWYSIDNISKVKINSTFNNDDKTQLTLSENDLREWNISEPGTYSIYTYVYDGLEYSNPTILSFDYYPSLSFKEDSRKINTTDIPTGVSNQLLTKQIKFSFELKNNVTKIYSQVFINGYDNDGQIKTQIIPESAYNFYPENQVKTIEIDLQELSLLPNGIDFSREIGFSYNISYQSSFEKLIKNETDMCYYCPLARPSETVFPENQPQKAIVVEINGASDYSQENYFSDILTISTYYPELGIPYPAHESMTAYFYKIGVQDSFKQEELDLVDDKWAKAISLGDAIQPGEKIRIELVYKDILGNILVHSAGEESYIKASAPRFTNNLIESVPQVIKPFSTLSWRFNHALAQAQGTDDIGIVYNYELQLPLFLRAINEYTLNEERVDYRRELILSKKEIQTLLLREEDKNLNENFLANLIITATDSFGKSTSISQEISIDYREAPSWSSNNFTLLHDYITTRSEGDGYDISSLSQITTGDINTQMFNAGEGIVFKIPKPVDINGYEDITNFVIYLYRDNLTEKGPESFEGKISKQWLTISLKDENLVEKGDFYYYRYTASAYQKNEYFYFEIAAQDSTGLISEALTTKDLPIFGCRTAVPMFDQGVVNTSVEKTEQDWKIELKWRSFTINDLGGSATLDGWNLDYYNIYPNLERAVPNYNKDIYLQVEISPTPDFTNRIEKILRDSDLSNYIDFKPYGSKGNNIIELILNQDKELKPAGLVNSEKFYLRFTLFIAYAPDAYIQSLPQIISYFGSVPTVSHRSHHVGINNTEFESDDVFVIQNYQNRSKIRFIGVETDESGQAINHIIEIDLNKGLISGASLIDVKIEKADFSNLIIDGGSW